MSWANENKKSYENQERWDCASRWISKVITTRMWCTKVRSDLKMRSVHCSVLQCTASECLMQCTAVSRRALHQSVWCSALQCLAVHCIRVSDAVHCSVLQCTASDTASDAVSCLMYENEELAAFEEILPEPMKITQIILFWKWFYFYLSQWILRRVLCPMLQWRWNSGLLCMYLKKKNRMLCKKQKITSGPVSHVAVELEQWCTRCGF